MYNLDNTYVIITIEACYRYSLQFWIFDLNNATSSNTTAIKTLRILKRSILLKKFFLKKQVYNFTSFKFWP